MLSTDDWRFVEARHAIFPPSFLASSRTPPQISTSHEKCHQENLLHDFKEGFYSLSRDKAARKCSIRGSTTFVRGTDAETKHLHDKASLLQDFPSRVPINVVTDDTPTSPHKSCKNSRNKKISKFTKSLYLFATVYKERRNLKVRKIMVPIATFL